MKSGTKICLFLLLVVFSWAAILQTQSYHYPTSTDIEKRINYLKRVVFQPLEQGADIISLGSESYEFMLFTYSFTSYALTNLAIRDSFYTNDAIEIINESIAKVLDHKIYSYYGIDSPIDNLDSLRYTSALYFGHVNLMLGCYRLLSNDSTYNDLNDKISQHLFDQYSRSQFLNLESYPYAIWIPDNTVAIASLKLHSFNTNSDFASICSKWTQYAKVHYIHDVTGVLYSTICPTTGAPIEEPRGSMLGWSIMFIYQYDSDFAIELYHNYKKHFSNELLFLRFFRERHDRKDTAQGDIDSGPLFLGYSIPANEFALANSILSGDYKTARKLERLINLGTKKICTNNELKYEIRFTKMNISPMAEAMVLNALTITKWTGS